MNKYIINSSTTDLKNIIDFNGFNLEYTEHFVLMILKHMLGYRPGWLILFIFLVIFVKTLNMPQQIRPLPCVTFLLK